MSQTLTPRRIDPEIIDPAIEIVTDSVDGSVERADLMEDNDSLQDLIAMNKIVASSQRVLVKRKKSIWVWRWFRNLVILTIGCMLVAALVFQFLSSRAESQAALVIDTGVSLNKFFEQYSDSLMAKDIDGALGCFSDRRSDKPMAEFRLDLAAQKDGVTSYRCRPDRTSQSTLRKQLEFLVEPFATIDFARVEILSLRIRDDSVTEVKTLVWIRGIDQGNSVESKCEFEFKIVETDDHWKIVNHSLLDGKTVVGSGSGFTDVTKSAGISFESLHNPMLDQPEWSPKRFGLFRFAGAGVSVADYNGDGNQDVFFCDGTNPTLYRGNGDGTFVDAMDDAQLPRNINAVQVAIFADLDNDGDQDLFLGRSTGANLLFRNDGQGRFDDVTDSANIGGVWVSTAAGLDYDNDGLLDLFVGRYLDPRTHLPETHFYSRNGQGALLLRNEGNLVFSDVTHEAGIHETGLSLGVSCADWDLDGDQDVYVANDFGRNAMLQNNGDGTFTDVTKETGTEDIGNGTSACFEDINADGRLDLYVASGHSGQRWLGNPAMLQRYLFASIKERTLSEDLPQFREIFSYLDGAWADFGERIMSGNSLLINQGDGTFTNVSERCRTNPPGWYWSSAVFDFDHDAQQDIYSVNGLITGKSNYDLGLLFMQSAVSNIREYKSGAYFEEDFRAGRSWNGNESNVLMRGEGFDEQGLPIFSDVAQATGAGDNKDARGMALGDFDNDGDLDMVINPSAGDCGKQSVPPVLLRNDIGHARPWMAIELIGKQSNRDAIGAQVKAVVVNQRGTSRVLLRHVSAGGGYASQNTKRLHFGLGEFAKIQSVEVRWLDGVTESFSELQPNTTYRLIEGQPEASIISPPSKEAVTSH